MSARIRTYASSDGVLLRSDMTDRQFNAALKRLDIESHRAAARVLGLGRSTIIRYAHGRTPVPESVIRLIDMLARHGIPQEYR